MMINHHSDGEFTTRQNMRGVLSSALKSRFRFDDFRPHQQEVCEAAILNRDVLLVMPTGAGKSLCYQLPVIAKDGARAIVISPLLALIEDQVQKLLTAQIPVDRIHSGRSRTQSQDACRAWREGAIKLLFIAPERLAIPGFMDFLEMHRPTMIAVDEAHCISSWGHDFRSDYRMLGSRLERLRPANIIAVTATATPTVQRDIANELRLHKPEIFIHGFRRTNIAVSVNTLSFSSRGDGAVKILQEHHRLPAIVYAPTRKIAEALTMELKAFFEVDVFHAGLPSDVRQDVYHRFMNDELQVIVATIAFGMGIDKPNIRTVVHTALPSSIEGYYQEIGRAGRDGATSSAVLLYSPIDLKTHEYFFEVNYPEMLTLELIASRIPDGGILREDLLASSSLGEDVFVSGLDKLWIHGGIVVDEFGRVFRAKEGWQKRYEAHRSYKKSQLRGVLNYASRNHCRMLQLLEHFGDKSDSLGPCKTCDVCLGVNHHGQGLSMISGQDVKLQDDLMTYLVEVQARTFGQIYKILFEPKGFPRRHVESLMDDLVAKKFLRIRVDSFEKDGRTIAFKWIELTTQGRQRLFEDKLAPPVAQQLMRLSTKKSKSKKRSARIGSKRR
jgi:DNA topoisomerase-3